MDPFKDEDDEVVFVEEIIIKGPQSKKARKNYWQSVVGRGKMCPQRCAAIKKGFVANELGSDDSFYERKPIAVIANTFSLSPNELHWAPDIAKTAESDTIAVNFQITDWEVPVAIDEDVTGKKLVDGNNPSSTFHTDTNEPRNTNTPPTQKDADIDSPLISELPSSICCVPIFPKLVENIEQGMHDRNEIESLKEQISMLSRKISEIDQSLPSCSSSMEQQHPQVTEPAPPKLERVELCCSSSDDEKDEDSEISDDTEPNESFEQGSNTANQLLEFNFSKIEPLSKEDVTTFVSHCKHVMKIRGLLYNDFTNWSDTRGYSCPIYKLSRFMNLKLGETGNRKMMFLLKQFLEDERGGLTMLSDAVESCIDKGRAVMKEKDLHNIDFLTWARLKFDLRLEISVIGNFMNKKLNERRSREILPFFLQFLNAETSKPKKRKRRDGFTPKQLSALMESFRTNPNPSQTLIQHLADHLGTTQFKVKRWFIERKHETKSRN